MIRRFGLLLVLIGVSLVGLGLTNNLTTPSVVKDFYNSMKELSTTTSEKTALDLQLKMQNCFLHGKTDMNAGKGSGIRVPNDFYLLGFKNNKKINSTLYTQLFKDKAFCIGERLKVTNVEIKESSYAKEVDLRKFQNEDIPYIQTLVTRTFSLGGKTMVFNDTILTKNNLICAFSNGIGDSGEDDLESLRALAARYYSSGLFKSAYNTYKKIINIDPKNANAYYRLGILSFWHGKKCGVLAKDRHSKGREYMDLAKKYSFSRAEIVKYYMDHPSSI